jgi:FdhD protein
MALTENSRICNVPAWKVQGQKIKAQQDLLAAESLLTLSINGLRAYQLLYLPGQEIELVWGFLLTSGIIEATADVVELHLADADPQSGRAYAQVQVRLAKTFENKKDLSAVMTDAVLTGAKAARQCLTAGQFRGLPGQPVQVRASEVITLMASLPERQETYRITGGTHAIFLAATGSGEVVLGAEDVGRHNAFDKVIGQALQKNLPTADKIALLSGRASFEMVFKAARAGIPVMASVSAPTCLAVKLAEYQGITLICFVRGGRLTLYTHPHRLLDLQGSG